MISAASAAPAIKRIACIVLLCLASAVGWAKSPALHTSAASDKARKMEWFADAKLGIFIHWGIYAVDGVGESWSFHNGQLSHADYMKQAHGFTAKRYDPEAWARLIRTSGARYAVLTSKHHDGMALWNSREGLNVVRDTPARRDLIGPFVEALRGNDLKVGLYYSLIDWSSPDYDGFLREHKRYEARTEPQRWRRFLRFYQSQLSELATRYRPDLYWFDGDWEHTAAEWDAAGTRDVLLRANPDAILNSRLAGHGDYATPEQGVPIVPPADAYWELCLTINDSWGWQPHDLAYKTPNQLIRIFADVIGMGGNLLLDIGPKADGSIDARQAQTLEAIGHWIRKHAEAIYGTRRGIDRLHYAGPSTLSKDGRTVYLFVEGRPSGPVLVKGLKNAVLNARLVGVDTQLKTSVVGKRSWSDVPGLLYVDIPVDGIDPDVTVVALSLDAPVQLHAEPIKPIESN